MIVHEIEQAKPFRLVDIDRVHPKLRGALICALNCGCRPNALQRIDDVKRHFTASSSGGQSVETEITVHIPKDKQVDSRSVRIFCTCVQKGQISNYCPIHSCPLPGFPIMKSDIGTALKSAGLKQVGYTTS